MLFRISPSLNDGRDVLSNARLRARKRGPKPFRIDLLEPRIAA